MPLRVLPSDKKLRLIDIAPCGMNCRLCYAFTRDKNRCPGCFGPDDEKQVSCIHCSIKTCPELAKSGKKYCGSCAKFPCRRLKQLDKRYRTKYGMSMIENLEAIKDKGVREFVRSEKKRWACPSCKTILCVHREDCVVCGHVWR